MVDPEDAMNMLGMMNETSEPREDPKLLPNYLQAVVQETGWDEDDSLCEYEKLRERNIKERMEAMKETLKEIEKTKQDLMVNISVKRPLEEMKKTEERIVGGG